MPNEKPTETRSTWSGFERLVVYRLDDAKARLERIEGQFGKMETDLKAVEIKSGIWGLMAGLIPAAIIIILGMFNSGCATLTKNTSATHQGLIESVHGASISSHAEANLNVLVYIGGISMLGGIAAMVITSGRFGIRALAIGCCCLLLNYAVARWATWVFLPILLATGAISLAYGWRVVREAIDFKKDFKHV